MGLFGRTRLDLRRERAQIATADVRFTADAGRILASPKQQ